MSKYVRVTHTYLVPMPDDLPDDDPVMETTINRGVSMMEEHMLKLYADPRRCVDLRTTWELVDESEMRLIARRQGLGIEKSDISITRGRAPRRLTTNDPVAKAAIEADADQGITFTEHVMGQRPGVTHPWEQGLFIFPLDHPLHELEAEFRKQYEHTDENETKQKLMQAFNGHVRELEAGDEPLH